MWETLTAAKSVFQVEGLQSKSRPRLNDVQVCGSVYIYTVLLQVHVHIHTYMKNVPVL